MPSDQLQRERLADEYGLLVPHRKVLRSHLPDFSVMDKLQPHEIQKSIATNYANYAKTTTRESHDKKRKETTRTRKKRRGAPFLCCFRAISFFFSVYLSG